MTTTFKHTAVSILFVALSMTMAACYSTAPTPDGLCQELPVLETQEELLMDREMCPTIFYLYQDRVNDDLSLNVGGVGCFEDLGCPGVQIACPYASVGGEAACDPELVRQCAVFLRDAPNQGLGLDEVEEYLRCNCPCN